MPPFVATSTVQARLVWTNAGADYAVNVLHYLAGSGTVIDQAAADEFAAFVGTAYGATSLAGYQSNTVDIGRITLRDIREPNLPEFSALSGVGGSGSTAMLPLATSMVITLRTALAGRSFRGRLYLTGFTEAANTVGGTIDPLANAQGVAFVDGLLDPIIGSSEWSLGVTSRQRDKVAIDPALTQAVTAVVARDTRWDVQRRRAVAGI